MAQTADKRCNGQNGIRNNIQRYKCTSCNKTFTFQKKLNPCDIWKDYSQGKQTYKELSIKYQCSVKTIQRYIDKAPKTALNPSISTIFKYGAEVD